MTDQTTTPVSPEMTIDELCAYAEQVTEQIKSLTRRHDFYVKGHQGKYSTSNPTNQQVRNLCKSFLLGQPGKTFDAIEATRELEKAWGISLDWHEMSYALDELNTRKQARVTRGGGMTEYIILPFGDQS